MVKGGNNIRLHEIQTYKDYFEQGKQFIIWHNDMNEHLYNGKLWPCILNVYRNSQAKTRFYFGLPPEHKCFLIFHSQNRFVS